ncbi:ABC transporter substrate-binding protein [Sphingomonas arenae]|uniref:ABC transporter substrate-binding protein n=1 Tax=Sphingomonas arenae TaxID=2812555 RepID=UPI001967792F|nr:extracellular solute-binding protein [Sphingomonas arenae]
MRWMLALIAAVVLGSCSQAEERTGLYIQRFFGECGSQYGSATDISKAEGECGIITTMINAFQAQHPDLSVSQNVVAWPGYPQLTAQMAARDPPDIVTMHGAVISDYAAQGLLEPIEPYLREAGIEPGTFTNAARGAVTVNGRIFGMPLDTHGGLWHINTRLFEQAGLMRGGKPVLPNSPGELVAHARQFRERTGKPYLIQSLVGDPAGAARNMYTYMMAQRAAVFPDPKHMRTNTPEGRRVADLFRRMTAEGLGTSNMDTPAAIAAFMNGEGGIYPTGTWMIGQFETEEKTRGRPLYRSYAVLNYPRLWGEHVVFVSGHAWVVPKRERTAEERSAIARFFRFMAEHNFDWARTGHLPAFQSIIDSSRFRALPHREDIAPLAEIGRTLPSYVQRQSAIEGIVGEEAAAAFTSQKPTARALGDADRRVTEFLAELP